MSTAHQVKLPNIPIPSYIPGPVQYNPHASYLSLVRYTSRTKNNIVKQAKSGGVRLRLTNQQGDNPLPTYGHANAIEGALELSKTTNIQCVEVKIYGRFLLREVGEGGSTTLNLSLDSAILWDRENEEESPCSSSMSFSLALPRSFKTEGSIYPLPPTYETHLSGMPGFQANISYSVVATVTRVKSLLNVLDGQTTVTQPFIYYPRSQPPVPLPLSLVALSQGLFPTPDWYIVDSAIHQKHNFGGSSIDLQFFIPATRIFCIKQPIPFHICFRSSAMLLASFMPYGPTVNGLSQSRRPFRVQLLRQATVSGCLHAGQDAKTDIWRVDCIGDATFTRMGDGRDWTAFRGEIVISDKVKAGGFKAGGLHVKDCLVLSLTPPDPVKSPFMNLRQVIPVRLATDMWTRDGVDFERWQQSMSSSADDEPLISPVYAQ